MKYLIFLVLFLSACGGVPTQKAPEQGIVETAHKGVVRSIHFGVNHYSKKAYGYAVNALQSCDKDAIDNSQMVQAHGSAYTMVYLNEDATIEAFKKAVQYLAKISIAGDTVVITQSSHGTFFTDPTGVEIDGNNEGTCFYNGIFWDDFIKAEIARFVKGVMVFTIWDTCHSGTGTRVPKDSDIAPGYLPKALGTNLSKEERNKMLKKFRKAQPPEADVACTWIHLGAAQDAEYALDGENNGNFTYWLKTKVNRRYKNGLDMNAQKLMFEIKSDIQGQTPNFDKAHISEAEAEVAVLPYQPAK